MTRGFPKALSEVGDAELPDALVTCRELLDGFGVFLRPPQTFRNLIER